MATLVTRMEIEFTAIVSLHLDCMAPVRIPVKLPGTQRAFMRCEYREIAVVCQSRFSCPNPFLYIQLDK